MTKTIAVPTAWNLYQVEDDIIALLGLKLETPPLIVLETLVFNGKAKRVAVIRQFDMTTDEEEDETTETKEDSPWYKEPEAEE